MYYNYHTSSVFLYPVVKLCIKDILQHKTWCEYSTIRLCFNTWGPSTSVGLLLLHSRGGGTSGFQVRGMIEGLFWVWNFWFWDDFVGGKIWQVFFGWLDLSRDILDIQTTQDSWWCPHISEIYEAWKFDMGFFLRFIFGPGIFWGFDICSHSIIPAVWNPKYPL